MTDQHTVHQDRSNKGTLFPNEAGDRQAAGPAAGCLLQADRLVGCYAGKPVLHGVSFSVGRGQIVGLLGPNGSGKSTLLRLLALVSRPDHGRILLQDVDAWTQVSAARRRIGYVPQEIALFEELSVADNLLCWTHLAKGQARRRMAEIARALNLEALLKQRVGALSGGMKRRVNLAVALMGDPVLLVLDEPFAGVDSENCTAMEKLLLQLAAQGTGLVISGHQSDQLFDLSGHLLLLKEGRLIFSGDGQGLLQQAAECTPRAAVNRLLQEAP